MHERFRLEAVEAQEHIYQAGVPDVILRSLTHRVQLGLERHRPLAMRADGYFLSL